MGAFENDRELPRPDSRDHFTRILIFEKTKWLKGSITEPPLFGFK